MSLIFSIVARKETILAENSNSDHSFTALTHSLLCKIPSTPGKLTYIYEQYLFHYIVSDLGITYLVMADEGLGRRIPFAFLEEIQSRFEEKYGSKALEALPYGMSEFSRILGSKMESFTNNASSDKIRQVQLELDKAKDVMAQNIEKVLERGEQIDLLVHKTDALNQASFQFKKRSTALKVLLVVF
jgi:vesicle-associated membrane protein 7